MRDDTGKYVFSASCAISMALIAITLCIIIGTHPVSGWTLSAMVFVSLLAMGSIVRMHKEGDDGQERKG